jgi:hypothetical protein
MPQQHVAVGDREPEVVLREAKQHRVIDDAPIFGGNNDVLALTDRAFSQVPRGEHVREREGVRAGDLDLAFDAHVPDGDISKQFPILGLEVIVTRRQKHMIVHRVSAAPIVSNSAAIPTSSVLCEPYYEGSQGGWFQMYRAIFH